MTRQTLGARIGNTITAVLLLGGMGLVGAGAVLAVRRDLGVTRSEALLLFLTGALFLFLLLVGVVVTSAARRPAVAPDPLVRLALADEEE